MAKYEAKYFRTVRHGLEEENAYCRHCDWSSHDKGTGSRARYHAKTTLHTVDVYREHCTEYTSYNPNFKK